MKEQKLGWVRGAASRSVMYYQMTRFRISYELHGRPPRQKKAPRARGVGENEEATEM